MEQEAARLNDRQKEIILEVSKHPTSTDVRSTSKNTEDAYLALPTRPVRQVFDLPDTFSGRAQWGPLLSEPMDQGRCGACWAFSTCAVLGDRFSILSRGRLRVVLSAAKMLICNLGTREYDIDPQSQSLEEIEDIQEESSGNLVCRGNTLADAWRYLFVFGTPPEGCFPYELDSKVSGPTLANISDLENDVPLCTEYAGKYGDLCIDGSPQKAYRCIQYYRVPGTAADGGTEEMIRKEIFARGPVNSAITIYPDFYEFDARTQVYDWDGGGPEISGHAVRITGWGESPRDGKFWWVANSFGKSWGVGGYFRMRRGQNICGVEENVIAGLPDMFLGTEDSMKLFGVEASDLGEDLDFRMLYESENSAGGGIDPRTGYTRFYYKLWPNLKQEAEEASSRPRITLPLAADVTWQPVRNTQIVALGASRTSAFEGVIIGIAVILLFAALGVTIQSTSRSSRSSRSSPST